MRRLRGVACRSCGRFRLGSDQQTASNCLRTFCHQTRLTRFDGQRVLFQSLDQQRAESWGPDESTGADDGQWLWDIEGLRRTVEFRREFLEQCAQRFGQK